MTDKPKTITVKGLRAGIAEAREEADRMVAGLHERAQSQETIRAEVTMLANRLRELDGAEPIADEPASPTEAEIAALKESLEPAGEPGSDAANDEAAAPRPSRRRPAPGAKRGRGRAAKKR